MAVEVQMRCDVGKQSNLRPTSIAAKEGTRRSLDGTSQTNGGQSDELGYVRNSRQKISFDLSRSKWTNETSLIDNNKANGLAARRMIATLSLV